MMVIMVGNLLHLVGCNLLVKITAFVMTMDSLASVHVFITLTLTYFLTICQHTESAHV